MQNSDDNELELEGDIYDDSFDAEFDEDFSEDFESDLDDVGELSAESDDLESFEEGYEEQDWDDSDVVDESLGSSREKKKLNLSFNTIVITGAVVVGLGVFAYQVLTKKPTNVEQKFTSALNMKGVTDGLVFGENDSPENNDQEEEESLPISDDPAFLFDPEIIDSMGEELQDNPPMPTPIVQEETSNSTNEFNLKIGEIENPETTDNQTTHTPRGSEASEEISLIQKIEIAPEPYETTEQEIVDPVTIDVPDVQDTQQKELDLGNLTMQNTQELTEQAEEIIIQDEMFVQENQEQEEESIIQVDEPETVRVEVTQPAVTNTTTVADSSDLSQKIDMIAQRLNDIEIQMNQIQQSEDSKIEDVAETVQSLKQQINKMNVVKSTTQMKSTSLVPTKTAKATPPKVQPPVSWELRAAQPGKAWVSQKGQSAIKPVQVGDSLSGIGRITSISYKIDRWVVQGTQGIIRQ